MSPKILIVYDLQKLNWNLLCSLLSVYQRPGKGGGVVGFEWGEGKGSSAVGSGDQIKKIFHLFLDDLEHIPDLKCILELEWVLVNINAFMIFNVLFKNFLSFPFHSFTNCSNIYKNAF